MSSRSVPAIINGNFFRVVEELGNGNVVVQCVPCETELQSGSTRGTKRDSSGGLKKGSFTATSNVLKHLKLHPAEHEAYKNYMITERKKNPEQPTISSFFPTTNDPARASTDDKLQMDYIIESMLPLYHIELPSFRRLVKGLKPAAKSLSYRTLSSRIHGLYLEEKCLLEKQLLEATWICCTADLWSSRRRS
ncbi:unnamed protein product [Allacma fusca]|uniref:BED-type domain-containing protein n=1 Tax=Allacma fusca TaxID=39272 RepID=A0A8J2LEE2_9HEXA|nr:unnamed protein product [Allacma fusca]